MSLFKSTPKKPEKTAQQVASEVRTRSLLDKEIADEEARLKLMSRGRLGRSSLVGRSARTRSESASGRSGSSASSSTSGSSSGSHKYSGGSYKGFIR